MTLTRLSLHNYMIHRDLTADFTGNLIALTGEMGHGKSTFVGAIQFCLTGEHPPWHREDLITWGETEGSAKLEFVQDGINCSILRRLNGSEAILKIGDESFSGVRNIEKALLERLGVDKDIIKQIGFVQQYEIQSILFDDPGKRERSFQKLLGIGDANKIWTELGPIIQSYSKPENFDASIESLRQTIAKLNESLASVDANLEKSRQALGAIKSKEELNSEIERLTKIQSNVRMLVNIRQSIATQNDNIAAYTKQKLEMSKKESSILHNLNCTLAEMEAFVDTLKTKHDTSLAELNNMKKLSGASDSNGICPLCGSNVAPGQILSRTESELKRLTAKESASRSEYSSTESMYASVKRELSLIEKEMNRLDCLLAGAVATLDSDKKKEAMILAEFAQLNISPEQADVGRLGEAVSNDMRIMRDLLETYDMMNNQIAVLQGEKNAKKQQLDQMVELLEAKVKEKELSVPMAKKLDTLSNVRNWFHSSNGPRTMSLSAIKSMTGYVNEYLTALHSEIEVVPDNNGLSFAFSYLDGRPISNPPPSTAKLSGGQKIELALAFRLAIYRYFGQKMGIMVLDEPTAHLSPSGIEYFGGLLQTVSTLAKNMNLQIIMPTHEKEIMPYMDSEIHFN